MSKKWWDSFISIAKDLSQTNGDARGKCDWGLNY